MNIKLFETEKSVRLINRKGNSKNISCFNITFTALISSIVLTLPFFVLIFSNYTSKYIIGLIYLAVMVSSFVFSKRSDMNFLNSPRLASSARAYNRANGNQNDFFTFIVVLPFLPFRKPIIRFIKLLKSNKDEENQFIEIDDRK